MIRFASLSPRPWLLVLLLLPAFTPLPWVRAEEPPAGEEEAPAGEDEAPALREATDDEARTLLAALKKVARKKNATDVLPTLESLDGIGHESFDKTLIKLLKHDSSLVALKVASMWTGRITPKNLKKVWAAAWGEKSNAKRFEVKSKVLLALASAGHVLTDKQYKEIERDWRWMIGNPRESYADALGEICVYFERTKDKRHCRWMAEELDDPCANANANDPNTQPVDWQERRWKMWKPMRPAAIRALKAITGQEFEKEEVARRWFEENEQTFGFKW